MKIFPVLILAIVIMASCSQNKAAENQLNDSIPLIDSLPSTATNAESKAVKADAKFGYPLDSYLVDGSKIDTAATQLISTTCAIFMEETARQAAEREKEEAIEYAQGEEAARKAWESQPHDSAEVFPGYFPGYEMGDVEYYFGDALDALSKLKVPIITAKSKDYVRLVGKNGQAYTLDIRSNMTPRWTIILFHINKSPVVVDAMDAQQVPFNQYFFNK